MSTRRPIILSFGLLSILNICDVVSTKILLDSGLFYEVNPFMDYLMQNFSFSTAMGVKIGILISLGGLILLYFKKKPSQRNTRILYIALMSINIYYIALLGPLNFRYLFNHLI